MKRYFVIFGIIGVLLVLFLTNPNETAHASAVKEILKKEFNKKMAEQIEKGSNGYEALGAGLGLMFGETLINKMVDAYVESDDYLICSLTKIKYKDEEKIIGVGVLGKVYISEKIKENAGQLIEKANNGN